MPSETHLLPPRLAGRAFGVALVFPASSALAHARAAGGAWIAPQGWFEPWVLVCLALALGLYGIGLARLWRRSGTGRGARAAAAAAFAAGWLVVALALVGPLDALAEELFSAHMVQHELLMVVAAPLLVLGRPLAVWVWAFAPAWRAAIGAFFHHPAWRRPWLVFTAPLSAWIVHALALWLWHVPRLFEAALRHEAVHTLQHVCFLGTALVFWWSVLGGVARRERGAALLSLFTTMVHTGALGALLAFSSVLWYPSYGASAPAHGLGAIEDQQLGGMVMWVPAGLVYIVCGLVLAGRWLSEPRPVRPRPRTTSERASTPPPLAGPL